MKTSGKAYRFSLKRDCKVVAEVDTIAMLWELYHWFHDSDPHSLYSVEVITL